MAVKMTRVWDATSDFLNERAGAVFALAAGLIFAPAFVGGLIERMVTPGTPAGIAMQLVGLFLSLVGAVGALAVTALAIRPMRPAEAAAIGVRRVLPFIGVSVVLLLVVLLASIPFVGIMVGTGVDLSAFSADGTVMPDIGTATAIALALYGLVFLGVMVWAGARLAVLLPVIVAERRGFGAIPRAWGLTRGHALRIVGVFILYGIVALVLSGGVGAAAGVIGALAGAGRPSFSLGAVFVAGALGIVSTLLSVVQSAFTGKLYTALAPAGDLEDIFA